MFYHGSFQDPDQLPSIHTVTRHVSNNIFAVYIIFLPISGSQHKNSSQAHRRYHLSFTTIRKDAWRQLEPKLQMMVFTRRPLQVIGTRQSGTHSYASFIDSSSSGSSFIWDPNMQTTNILVIMYHLSLQIRLSWMFFRIIFVISLVVHRHSSRATTSTGATFGPASGTIFTSCCLTRMGGKGKSRVRCRKQLWRQDWCTMTHRDTQGYPLWLKERPAYILWSRLVFYCGQRRFDSPGSAILIMLTGPVAGSGYSGYWCWWRDNWCQHVSAQFKFGKVQISVAQNEILSFAFVWDDADLRPL